PPTWADAGRDDLLPADHQLEPPQLLFRKIEDDVIERQMQKLEAARVENAPPAAPTTPAPEAAPAPPPPVKDEITFDDFTKLDLRVATVLAAERVPKTDKLMKLQLDAGGEARTVVSGIAQHFAPEEVVGKQVCLLANLAPRKMRGILSQGMILMAEDADGRLVFVAPTDVVRPGSGVS
ncbi:MAG: methionine--tRNA ligase subunit beta, partial [Catalinimonas sp.]